MKKIILASASPRRKQLLTQIGLNFVCSPANLIEDLSVELSPQELAENIAFLKALEVSKGLTEGIVIAADTVVVLGDKVIGKPANRDEAFQYLYSLSGQCHQVITGLCILDLENHEPAIGAEITKVFFRTISPSEINHYLDYNEWEDKAGAYAIQGYGALLVDHIEGCYYNVVGLPLNRLHMLLRNKGVDLLGG